MIIISSKDITKIYRDKIWKLHGVLQTLVCFKIHRRFNKSIKNKENIIYGILFSDR